MGELTSEPKPSGRKGVPKVRTGCITCKIRKVKCDEAKPSCQRCLNTGRRCDGYAAAKSTLLARRASSAIPPPNALNVGPRFQSELARRMFEYYQSQAAFQLGGVLDLGFWQNRVLQFVVPEQAVKHAVTAIGSIHATLTLPLSEDRKREWREFGLSEYGRAVTAIRPLLQSDDAIAMALLVCSLFVCIELMLGQKNAAHMHILQGRKILVGVTRRAQPMYDLIKSELVPLWRRLSIAGPWIAKQVEPIPRHLIEFSEVPDRFESIRDARNSLFHLIDEAYKHYSVMPLHFPPHFEDFRQRLDIHLDPRRAPQPMAQATAFRDWVLKQMSRWHAAFDPLLLGIEMNRPLAYSAHVLLISAHFHTLWSRIAFETCEFATDNEVHEFAQMVSAAKQALHFASDADDAQSFTCETEFLPAMSYTVLKCRHPQVRRDALNVLKSRHLSKRREHSCTTSRVLAVASRVMEIEESGFLASLVQRCKGRTASPDLAVEVSNLLLRAGPAHSSWIDGSTESCQGSSSQAWDRQALDVAGEGVTPEAGGSAVGSAESDPRNRSPFGVPYAHRVLNVVVEEETDTGSWIRMYHDPGDETSEWKTTREHVLADTKEGRTP